MLAAIVLVVVVLVVGGVASLCARRSRPTEPRGRLSGTTFVIGLPPVPAPHPRLDVPPMPPGGVVDRHVAGSAQVRDVILAPPIAVPRPVRRCGNCRAVGHSRPACPRLTGAVPLPHL